MFVQPISINQVLIQWTELEGDYFRLSRSTSPVSEYEIIANHLMEPFYLDDQINLFKIGITYYYRVEGYVGGIVVSKETAQTAHYNAPDGIANKVIWENKLALRVMNNPDVFILLKQRDSKPCLDCFNEITNKPRFADCTSCNGTGYTVGYHTPIRTKISRDFSQVMDASDVLNGDKSTLSAVSAWITNHPLVFPGDIIVDVLNQRFLIEATMKRTRSQFTIRQILNLIPLEKGHPAYQVEVKFDELRK